MYGIFIYIWLKFMANVGEYTIHGSYGIVIVTKIITMYSILTFASSMIGASYNKIPPNTVTES